MELIELMRPPAADLIRALSAMADSGGVCPDGPVAAFRFGETSLVVLELLDGVSRDAAVRAVSRSELAAVKDETAFKVMVVAVSDTNPQLPIVLGRGIVALDLHDAVAELAGLPAGWRDSQGALVDRALSSLLLAGSLQTAGMYGVWEGGREVFRAFLEARLLRWEAEPGLLLYCKAEAGKGKSTALAELVWKHQCKTTCPLPLLIPLRSVQRGIGASWASIAASIGVVGPQAQTLAKAVQCGLVCPLLDGLDELSGRYDPTLVSEFLTEIRHALSGPASRVAISGRTTEAQLLKGGAPVLEVALELPGSTDDEFVNYVNHVVTSVIPGWPAVAARVPEPPLERPSLPDAPLTVPQHQQIVEWICRVFDRLGKERSLFFVQSLACIARTYQLAGNKPLVIDSGLKSQLAPAGVYEVCILAAALACVREQDKVEEIAGRLFAPASQLEVLTWLALKASVESSRRDQLPGTKALAQSIFGIDPVNQNEEFTAVVRQLQKHALLFASIEPSAHAGDWRPQFLSDWVRCALLSRAWLNKNALFKDAEPVEVIDAIARSERAGLAFGLILPELVSDRGVGDLPALCEALRRGSEAESPEAAANYWFLWAGLSEEQRPVDIVPSCVPPMTDLTGLTVSGSTMPHSFGGTYFVGVEAEFEGVSFEGNRFDQCDFTGTVFRNCHIKDVAFDACDGPMRFEDCRLERLHISGMRGRSGALLIFGDCELLEGCVISQSEPPSGSWQWAPVVTFVGCVAEPAPSELLTGDCLGFDPQRVQGLDVMDDGEFDLAEACAKAILKPFFPVRAGTTGERQARGYIRSSALGRGIMPAGAPPDNRLFSILEGLGFSDGGRQGHLYAPWSSVGGASADGGQLRNELLAFLTSGSRCYRVDQLIERIRAEGSWS